MRLHEEPGSKPQKVLSWKDVEKHVNEIVDHIIISDVRIKTILAIGRGGLIPAAMLTYCLSKKLDFKFPIAVQYASSYNDLHERKQVILGPCPTTYGLNRHILIVDEIADSGHTLNAVLDRFPGALTAVLVHKEQSVIEPDYCGIKDTDGEKYWYCFPWEASK